MFLVSSSVILKRSRPSLHHFWWALEVVDVYIYLDMVEGGPPAAEEWEMIIAIARKA